MVCAEWKTKMDTYVDGELASEELHALDSHVRSCPSCAADVLSRMQMKRQIRGAGNRFAPDAEFRKRIQQSIAPKPRRMGMNFGWMPSLAMVVILVAAALTTTYVMRQRAHGAALYSEIVDLHVATLASASPVDVVSSDRHTVKPWFQGKIPFTFDLPEIDNTKFSLLGGRVAYLSQTPGAELIYEVRKHRISVFIFREDSLGGRAGNSSSARKDLSFNTKTWSHDGFRYYVIGDASAADIDDLSALFSGS